jgi:hypothetical protein
MTDSAALLADEVLPQKPLRQWVLSLPFALRFLLATDAEALTQVLGVVYRTISAYVLKKARLPRARGATGAVTRAAGVPEHRAARRGRAAGARRAATSGRARAAANASAVRRDCPGLRSACSTARSSDEARVTPCGVSPCRDPR